MWDVFISHATEDQALVARPLAKELESRGFKVWYSESALKLGDSLRRKITQGLAQSRFGVVVLSPHFFSKEWPERELDGLSTREDSGTKVILPVWHDVSKAEVANYSVILADRLAVHTSLGISVVADAIEQVIREDLGDSPTNPKHNSPELPQRGDSGASVGGEVSQASSARSEPGAAVSRSPMHEGPWTRRVAETVWEALRAASKRRQRLSGIALAAVAGMLIYAGTEVDGPAVPHAVTPEAPQAAELESQIAGSQLPSAQPFTAAHPKPEPRRPQDSAAGIEDKSAMWSPLTSPLSSGVGGGLDQVQGPVTGVSPPAPRPPAEEERDSRAARQSVREIVWTDGTAIYYDPQNELPGACAMGARVLFNGGGDLPGSAPVRCVDGKLVFEPLALARWSDRINPNTGHCFTFARASGSGVHHSRSLAGANEVLTSEGYIGFRIDVSVEAPDAPRVVLSNASGKNGSNPCYL